MNRDDLKKLWEVFSVEETLTLVAVDGLIRNMLRSRGFDIKGISKEVDEAIKQCLV